jgi:two-component system chemotaxis response regulator CheY
MGHTDLQALMNFLFIHCPTDMYPPSRRLTLPSKSFIIKTILEPSIDISLRTTLPQTLEILLSEMEDKMRIMIVDDEFTARNALKMVLSEFGECVVIESGIKAIEQFIKAWADWKPFDLIMLDFELDNTTGLKVLHDIRLLEQEKGIPVKEGVKIIMITGHSAKEIVMECLTSGCNDFVVKPVDKQTVKDKLLKLGASIRVFGE